MRHGYTNATISDGQTVVKRYLGPDAAIRQQNEAEALSGLRDLLPVPPLLGQSKGVITLGLAEGRPGQELLETAPEPVLYAVGRIAGRLATIDISRLPGLAVTPSGTILVHGDFGPQNMLFDDRTAEPTAVVDWEHAHIGAPVEDLAWAEWIVRTHHPHLLPALPALFAGYGGRPPWVQRRAVMLEKCRWALGFAHRWPGAGTAVIELWQRRLAATTEYTEVL